MKNKFYIIILFLFIPVILGKLYYFQEIHEAFSRPMELQILNITGVCFVLISLTLISLKPILARLFLVLGVLSGYSEFAWKYMLNEISISYLGFLIFGISFLSFFLWSCTSAELEIRKKFEETPIE